jgi:phosphate transport system permease protein
MNNVLYHSRKVRNVVALSLALAATVAGLFILALILFSLFVKGGEAIKPSIFTQMTPPPGSAGGLLNAIYGSVVMTCIGILVGTPLGIMAGTYLAEYGKSSKLAHVVRFINDILLSAPSIAIGMFIYAVMVAPFHHFSAWAGSMALAVIVVPVVVRTTEDMLNLVPNTLRESAFALGTPKWKSIMAVTYRAARNGMITGVLLALARISGETAPLLFTALNSQFFSTNMNAPMANLPYVIYQFAVSPYDDWQELAWGGALLITVGILILNIIARYLASLASERK